MSSHPLTSDLNYILTNSLPAWEALRNETIFITGGTGFFGCWLLESLIWANRNLNLNTRVCVLTRSAERFREKYPLLANASNVFFHEGDVRSYQFPNESISHIIHGASNPSLADSQEQLSTIVEGTQRTLEFAKHCKAKRFLLISSGAVYGKQPHDISHLTEDHPFTPADNDSAYTIGKRTAETLAISHATQHSLDMKIARCFAFVGPYLPLDAHFAIGNFLNDGLRKQPIHITNGNVYRSYMYAADLVIWLLTILIKGESIRPYNVGSDNIISVSELATLVSNMFSQPTINSTPSANPAASRYIPNIQRACSELQLKQGVDLITAIEKTKTWYVSRK